MISSFTWIIFLTSLFNFALFGFSLSSTVYPAWIGSINLFIGFLFIFMSYMNYYSNNLRGL